MELLPKPENKQILRYSYSDSPFWGTVLGGEVNQTLQIFMTREGVVEKVLFTTSDKRRP
jgi:hypothetical protein